MTRTLLGTYWTGFGRRLAHARIHTGLSQTELADEFGRSRSSIANIEAGRQRLNADDIITIANLLDTDPVWLFTGDTPTTPAVPVARTVARTATALADLLDRHATELRALTTTDPG